MPIKSKRSAEWPDQLKPEADKVYDLMQEEDVDVDFSDLSICSEELRGGKSTVERMIRRIQE